MFLQKHSQVSCAIKIKPLGTRQYREGETALHFVIEEGCSFIPDLLPTSVSAFHPRYSAHIPRPCNLENCSLVPLLKNSQVILLRFWENNPKQPTSKNNTSLKSSTLWCYIIYTMEYCSALKREEILLHATASVIFSTLCYVK